LQRPATRSLGGHDFSIKRERLQRVGRIPNRIRVRQQLDLGETDRSIKEERRQIVRGPKSEAGVST
jgi:hypothetical protein